MGVGANEGGDERVAVEAASSPDSLDVAGRISWNRGQHDGGQVADVDTHFKCGCGCDEIGCVRCSAGLERCFEVFSLLSPQDSGVFSGDHTPSCGAAISGAVVVGRFRGVGLVAADASVAQAETVDPVVNEVRWDGVA